MAVIREPVPDEVRVILDRVQRNALPMAAWEQSAGLPRLPTKRRALEICDGQT
ncbi:hypothetical protein [Streptomyces sp. NPDC087212]|uniref:hypothetical protein n=1 Tax=Streptomyces sp. NPDC087212 TaxID=3365766 RepID=UPI003815C912